MLKRVTSLELIEKLQLTPFQSKPSEVAECNETPNLKQDLELINLHWRFVMDLISNRIWSQSFHTLLPPYNMAMMYATEPDQLVNIQKIWKTACATVLDLEEFVKKNPQNPHARSLLSAIGTHHWQLTREIFKEGIRCGWKPADDTLKAICHALFNCPMTTKQSLESGFNHIKDHSRDAKANKMSPWTRYSYLAVNPHVTSGGIATINCDTEDFSTISMEASIPQEIEELNPFTGVRSAQLPEECPTSKELQERV